MKTNFKLDTLCIAQTVRTDYVWNGRGGTMSKRRVKERRKRAHEFKRLIQVHGGRKMQPTAPPDQHLPPRKAS
jgi:hypothetical protein